MRINLLFIVLAFASGVVCATDLPDGFILKIDRENQAHIEKDGEIVIHPNIVSIGHNDFFIVGCIEGMEKDIHVSKKVLPGYFILPLNGSENQAGLLQVISRQNWEYFRSRVPRLASIKLATLNNGKCEYVHEESMSLGGNDS